MQNKDNVICNVMSCWVVTLTHIYPLNIFLAKQPTPTSLIHSCLSHFKLCSTFLLLSTRLLIVATEAFKRYGVTSGQNSCLKKMEHCAEKQHQWDFRESVISIFFTPFPKIIIDQLRWDLCRQHLLVKQFAEKNLRPLLNLQKQHANISKIIPCNTFEFSHSCSR